MRANVEATRDTVAGRGPDEAKIDPEAGARMVVNLSSEHVPAFCEASRKREKKPFKNGYDLHKYHIGGPPSGEKLKNREIVDRALPFNDNDSAEDVYFGAVELNGAGIRFYGDACPVLGR